MTSIADSRGCGYDGGMKRYVVLYRKNLATYWSTEVDADDEEDAKWAAHGRYADERHGGDLFHKLSDDVTVQAARIDA